MRHLLALGALFALAPAPGALAQPAAGQPTPATAVAVPPTSASQASSETAASTEQAPAEVPPGVKALNLCRACHTLDQGARTLIGPNLYGIFGRQAGIIEGYRYSVNMRRLAETGHVWSDENLRKWIAHPQSVVPQTAMKFPGLSNVDHLNELMPLLKQATGAP